MSCADCPACGGKMQPLYPTRFPGQPWMQRCPTCGFCAVHPLPSDTSAVYDDAYTASPDAEQKNRRLAPGYFAKIRPHLPAPPFRFLEVGGSHGWLAQHVRDECSAEVLLLEPGRSAVAAAQSRGLNAQIGYLETFTPTDPFDVLCAAHVIEHVADIDTFLTAAHRALRPGGKLLLLTPNADAWKLAWFGRAWAWAVPDGHTHFLTADSARRLLTRHGFAPQSIETHVPGLAHYPYFLARWMAEHHIPRPVRLPFVALERIVLAIADALIGKTRADELLVIAQRT